MRLCPLKNDKNNTWYVPLDERLFKGDSTAFYTAMGYFKEVFLAAKSNDYAKASTELKKLKDIQRKSGAKVVPSEFAVDLEVRYNKLNVFKSAQNSYLGIGLLSLLIFFLSIFTKTSSKVTKVIRILGKAFTFLLILVFIYHGLGLAMRWYISGHAPWSNGYEAVVFIAWVTMLSGFIFSRKNIKPKKKIFNDHHF